MARILFLMSYFQQLGGTERAVTRLATAMAAKHDVHVCALSAEEAIDLGRSLSRFTSHPSAAGCRCRSAG